MMADGGALGGSPDGRHHHQLNDSGSSTGSARSKQERQCGVCGDRALGYNFNAVTCESCKAFFRRNAFKNKNLKCPFQNNCTVDTVTRRFCQKCRLQKCFDIGMKKEWIMTEEEKLKKKQKIEANKIRKMGDGKRPLEFDSTDSHSNLKLECSSSQSSSDLSPYPSVSSSAHPLEGHENLLKYQHIQETFLKTTPVPSLLPFSNESSSKPQAVVIGMVRNADDQQQQLVHTKNQLAIQNKECLGEASPVTSSHEFCSAKRPRTELVHDRLQAYHSDHHPFTSQMRASQEDRPEEADHLTTFHHSKTLDSVSLPSTSRRHTPFNSNPCSPLDQLDSNSLPSTVLPTKASSVPPSPTHFHQVLGDRKSYRGVMSPRDPFTNVSSAYLSQSSVLEEENDFLSLPISSNSAGNVNHPQSTQHISDLLGRSPASSMGYTSPTVADVKPVTDGSCSPYVPAGVGMSGTRDDQPASGSLQEKKPVEKQGLLTLTSGSGSSGDYHSSPQGVLSGSEPISGDQISNKSSSVAVEHDYEEEKQPVNNTQSSYSADDSSQQQQHTPDGGETWSDFRVLDALNIIRPTCAADVTATDNKAENTLENIVNNAVKAEYSPYSVLGTLTHSTNPLTAPEKFKLAELHRASAAMNAPLSEDEEYIQDHHNPSLINVINMTDIAIRRLIQMSKQLPAFSSLCTEDQIALLKGSCTEMMILRSLAHYDADKDSWKIPEHHDTFKSIKLKVLKGAPGNAQVYEEHKRFTLSFEASWRHDQNIMLLLSAITLFTPSRANVKHPQAIEYEQCCYLLLLKRYLESQRGACEGRTVYLKLLERINDLRRLNENHLQVYMQVNPEHVRPLIIEIFDLKNR